MFSSLASVFGNIGQCDYSYANSFMDHFAENRENMRIQGNVMEKQFQSIGRFG
ncbi:KR domain-containing protein [Bacillus velezensis]|uniref:KR domain-containing protein n=1 Tax=Bacillus velezensis TaxID=492670 RepID=UPI0018E8570E